MPLSALVDANSAGDPLDEEQSCVATAVYFESQGESLEGQLAVAQVVLNRAASGQYPTSLCAVVKQKAQFSFVRAGRFPRVDPNCDSWRKAQAITRIATRKLASTRADQRAVVSRQLCRTVVAAEPHEGRQDRRAHFLPGLIAGRFRRPVAVKRQFGVNRD